MKATYKTFRNELKGIQTNIQYLLQKKKKNSNEIQYKRANKHETRVLYIVCSLLYGQNYRSPTFQERNFDGSKFIGRSSPLSSPTSVVLISRARLMFHSLPPPDKINHSAVSEFARNPACINSISSNI